jgi:hypothetical protein
MNHPARTKLPTVRTRGADRVLEDVVLETPVGTALRRWWKRALLILLAIFVLVRLVSLACERVTDKQAPMKVR